MLDIKNFLSKFRKMELGGRVSLSNVINSIVENSGVRLDQNEVLLNHDGILRINSSPIKRTEVFMSKDKIITDLKSRGISVRDIR